MNSGVKVEGEQALAAKAWPFEEARKLLARIEARTKAGQTVKGVLFETGYGPSGLPHIGTFGEVARTTWVRHAFETMSDIPTHLIAFSDDMDGLRKVPDNLPQPEMLAANLGKPLTAIPDPFGTHESFGHHMNARLRAFLDRFGFRYEFYSAPPPPTSPAVSMKRCCASWRNYDKVMDVMLPTLGEERQQTYSPFLPVSPRSGKVLLAKVVGRDAAKGTITYIEEDGSEETVPVTGGHCKLQWKPDMGMRWAALGVDYEMYGKDHLPRRRSTARSAKSPAALRPSSTCTSCSSTTRARRSPSPRATASASTNGCVMARRKAWRCSCSRSRARPSGSIST